EDHDEDEQHQQEQLATLPSDVFYVAFDATGAVRSNPRRVNLEGVGLAGLTHEGYRDPTDVHGEHGNYRMNVTALDDGSYLAVGRSLRLIDHQLETLRLVFGVGSVLGLGISIASGYLLAGRTLRPIRRAMESQRQFVSDASH